MKAIYLLAADPITTLVNSAPAAPTGDDLYFGMTFAGLVLAGLFSLLGMGYLVYAKKQAKLIVGLTGLGLMIFPFFITGTLAMAVTGVILLFLPYLLARVGVNL